MNKPGVSNFNIDQLRQTCDMLKMLHRGLTMQVHTRSPDLISFFATSATCSGVKYLSMPNPSSLLPGSAGQKRNLFSSSSHLGSSAKVLAFDMLASD